MKTLGIEAVDLMDSYLLGWQKEHDSLVLFLELLLTEAHPHFEPFDEEHEYGCYKLGSFIFNEVTSIQGLFPSELKPRWNETQGEYDDVTEINGVSFEDKYVQIETDNSLMTIYCTEAELIVANIGWIIPIYVPRMPKRIVFPPSVGKTSHVTTGCHLAI